MGGAAKALLSRYEHFRGVPHSQRAKMAEFIFAVLAMADERRSAPRKTGSIDGDSHPGSEEPATEWAAA